MGIIRTEPRESTTTQILTNKTFDDEITVKEIGEPASPEVGYRKVYFDFTDGLYKAKSATGEVIILNSSGGGGEMAQYSATKSYFKGEKCIGSDGFEYRSLFNNNVGNPIDFVNGGGSALNITAIASTTVTCATASASNIPSAGIISIEDQLFEYSSLSLDRLTFNFGDNGNSTGGAGTSRRITEAGWTYSADNSWSNGFYHFTLAIGMKVKSGYWKKVGYTKKYFLNKLPSSDTITTVINADYVPYYGANFTSAIVYSGGSGGGSGAGGTSSINLKGGGAGGVCKYIITPKINIGTILNLSPSVSYTIGVGGAGGVSPSAFYRGSNKGAEGTPSKFIDFYSPKTIGANGGYVGSGSTDYSNSRGGEPGNFGYVGGHNGAVVPLSGNGGVGESGFSGEVNSGGVGASTGTGGTGSSGASNNYGSGGGGGGGAGTSSGTQNGGTGGAGSNGCVIVVEEW